MTLRYYFDLLLCLIISVPNRRFPHRSHIYIYIMAALWLIVALGYLILYAFASAPPPSYMARSSSFQINRVQISQHYLLRSTIDGASESGLITDSPNVW
jgi:hypothetical protein